MVSGMGRPRGASQPNENREICVFRELRAVLQRIWRGFKAIQRYKAAAMLTSGGDKAPRRHEAVECRRGRTGRYLFREQQ